MHTSFKEGRGYYGSPRVQDDLVEWGERVSRKRTLRLMKEDGLKARVRKRYKVTTDSDHDQPIAAKLLQQAFTAERPNQRWARDTTRLVIGDSGKLYLAVILDLFSRFVVGRAVGACNDRDLTIKALEMALKRLTVINGVAELALEKAHEGSRDGVEADLAEIRLAGERAAGLTRQLLAFSRKQIMRPQVMNLSAVVSEMAKMLHRLLGEDVELTISATDPAFVHADRGQVEQVIANLAVNARDAMPHGGALAIEVNSETIGEEGSAIAERGRFVTLTVRDTGTGMDEDIRRQIFEPFFTTKGPAKGTGLGLSTVYGIVKQSNGYIRVDSEAGRGTRFTIYLPQVEDAAAAAPESVPAESGGTETVLIVEDVIGVRHLMTRVLESGGYTVLSAGSGVEAIAMLEGYPHRVDLLITDVVMPGMSGRELAERVAAMRPDLQFLYMSGYTDDVVLRHIVLEQGTPFISKPFTKAQLLSMIRQLLTSR